MIDMGLLVSMVMALAPQADPATIEAAVQDWLDDHPEATTTVTDGSITMAKLASEVASKINQITSLSDEIVNLKKKSIFVNVKEYGAVGDGITNDRPAIQAALDAVGVTGGTLFFPAGTYNIEKEGAGFAKSYLYVSSNTTLVFDNGAVIRRADTYTAHLFMTKNDNNAAEYSGASNITFDGMCIDCGGGTGWATAICTSHAQNIHIRNCKFTNGAGNGHYIEINSSKYVDVRDCLFEKADSMVMYLQIESASGHGNAGQNDNTPACYINIEKCVFFKTLNNAYSIFNEVADDASHDIRIHTCCFNDGATNGYIRFLANITNVDIYENTFNAGLGSNNIAVKIEDTNNTCTVHDNRFIAFSTPISGTVMKYNNLEIAV